MGKKYFIDILAAECESCFISVINSGLCVCFFSSLNTLDRKTLVGCLFWV